MFLALEGFMQEHLQGSLLLMVFFLFQGQSSDPNEPPNKKPRVCTFGEECYRRNPVHLDELSHPHLDVLLAGQEDKKDLVLPSDFKSNLDSSLILDQLHILQGLYARKNASTKQANENSVGTPNVPPPSSSGAGGRGGDKFRAMKKQCRARVSGLGADYPAGGSDVAARLEAAAPYYFFLTKVRSAPMTHSEPLSITFRELLDPSLGQLEASVQINFMVEMPWLMHHYFYHKLGEKSLLILHGEDNNELKNLPKNITAVRIRPPHPFGHHHTKMSLFRYNDDSLRVVVSTANLVASDWHNRTQGLWVSPRCPPLPLGSDTSAGESPTEFKADLLRYLTFYQVHQLQEWLGYIRRTDFSHIRVFFIASVPGTHQASEIDRWGHRRLGNLLKKHVSRVDSTWPVVAQCSSIGSLGQDPPAWMCGELRASMSHNMNNTALQTQPAFKVVYPSKQNVYDSLDGPLGGDCLPYSIRTHQKQMWFGAFLYEWKSIKRHRSGAVPHIKTYTRLSPCGKQLAWFHLSSANLSKAAWGMNKTTKSSGSGLFMMSYEAGVLFVPQLLVDSSVFNLESDGGDGSPPFPLPYDVPLVRYSASDKPWVMEYLSADLKSKK